MLYDQFGDKQPIIKHYPSMKKWMRYMKDKYMVDHIMTKDNFGDWCMPPESPELIHSKDPSRITEAAVLGTTFYYYLSNLMVRFAALPVIRRMLKIFGKRVNWLKKLLIQNTFIRNWGIIATIQLLQISFPCGSAWFLRLIRKSCSGI